MKGVGTGSEGRVGFDRGKGEGSQPKPKRAQGGGSGGLDDEIGRSAGSPSSAVGNSRSHSKAATREKRRRCPSPALISIPPSGRTYLFPCTVTHDRSRQHRPMDQEMAEGWVTHNGTGIGDGNGDGFGPGSDGNMGGDPRELGGDGPGGGIRKSPVRSRTRISGFSRLRSVRVCSQNRNRNTRKKPGEIRSRARSSCVLFFPGLVR